MKLTNSQRTNITIAIQAELPDTSRDVAKHLARPSKTVTREFTKPPSIIKRIIDPNTSKEALLQLKSEKIEMYFLKLIDHLRQENPNTESVKTAIAKISNQTHNASIYRRLMAVPRNQGKRNALRQEYQTIMRGIKTVGNFEYLVDLKSVLEESVLRMDEADIADNKKANLGKLDGGKKIAMSENGAMGVLLIRPDSVPDDPEISSHELIVTDPDSELIVTDPESSSYEQPPLRLAQVLKPCVSSQDQEALELFKLMDTVNQNARLPFGYPQTVQIESNSKLHRKVNRHLSEARDSGNITCSAHRADNLVELMRLAEENSIVMQELIDGTPPSEATFEKKIELVSDQKSCKLIGESFVVCHMLNLGDHLQFNDCGFTNWSNVILADDGKLVMIDLSARPLGLNLEAMNEVVKNLMEIEKAAKNQVLPPDWHVKFTSLGEFFKATYKKAGKTAAGYLFSPEEFKDAVGTQMKPPEIAKKLEPILDQAGPSLISGIVTGIQWVVHNAEMLVEAHEKSLQNGDDENMTKLTRDNMNKLIDVFKPLTPKICKKLHKLQSPTSPVTLVQK